MAPPYSTDFQWRMVWLKIVNDMSTEEIASLMNISEQTVRRYISKFHRTGDVKPKEHRNVPRHLLDDFEQLLLVRILAYYTYMKCSKNLKAN